MRWRLLAAAAVAVAVLGVGVVRLLGSGKTRPLAILPPPPYVSVRVVEVERELAPPPEFLEASASSEHFLLRVRARIRGLHPGIHPGDFVVDRINGGPSRVETLRHRSAASGELWDYAVTGPSGGAMPGMALPQHGACWVQLHFVVPMNFETGVLDRRGRSLARLSLRQ